MMTITDVPREIGDCSGLSFVIFDGGNCRVTINGPDAMELARSLIAAYNSSTNTSAEEDADFAKRYSSVTDHLELARTLSGRLRQMDKRARAANERADKMEAALRASTPTPVSIASGFQQRVSAACDVLFDGDPTDVPERLARFFEESNETCQALGMTREEAHQLVDYTYGRPAGDPSKEAGSVMVTLAAVCVYADLDMMGSAETDLEKLQRPETIARIRAKRATRHGRGPLPGFDPARATEGLSRDPS